MTAIIKILLIPTLTAAIANAAPVSSQGRTISAGFSSGDYIFFAFVVVVVLLLVYLKRIRGEIKRTEERISRLKHETDKKLIDGIFYAQSLQQSILPEESKLKDSIQDHFVLYMPKDLVSGDFYWYRDFDGFGIAAVVDCTGHGIPGGFMSMLGNTLLNRIILEKNILTPSEILEKMDEGIRDILKQDEEGSEADDGMEICICKIDRINKQVVFSGAHRPLFYYSGGRMYEIKGTTRAIGGRTRKRERKPFYNHTVNITEDTAIYLASDGLTDQNDQAGSKFGKKRLLETIESTMNLPMTEQKYRLINELNTFRKSTLQRDDITVLGIKL